MHNYKKNLKTLSRDLRKNQTAPELMLWYYLRKKQVANTQFSRQKPIGPYIVDFYARTAQLVIELDGSQHYENEHRLYDQKRDAYLESLGLTVLRFNNLEVVFNTEMVIRVIASKIEGKPYTYVHGEFIELS